MAVYWLVLIVLGTTPTTQATSGRLLHVGNFPTMSDCEYAAKNASIIQKAPVFDATFVCLQANVAGTNPPP
jgi:hypothetical protein